MAVVDADGNIV